MLPNRAALLPALGAALLASSLAGAPSVHGDDGGPAKPPCSAGTRRTVTQGGSLNGPLGVTVERNGDILTVNSADGFLTPITPAGRQVSSTLLDGTGGPPPGAGTLFGLVPAHRGAVYFVDDGTNTLNIVRGIPAGGE